ncbi:hypothetical protein CU048_09325 [Beijerinckiaceae bacterium]|nr:hypothetical protein CU048_09325 [Beijerinckiaceae bacterium]
MRIGAADPTPSARDGGRSRRDLTAWLGSCQNGQRCLEHNQRAQKSVLPEGKAQKTSCGTLFPGDNRFLMEAER